MNTDSTRPGVGPAEEPTPIGAALRPVEDGLRRSLDAEARSITPNDRLGAILADAHTSERFGSGGPGGTGSRGHRWLVPAVAAAAAVLVAGTVWAANRPPTQAPPAAQSSTDIATPTQDRSSAPSSNVPSTAPSSAPSSVPTRTADRPSTPPTSVPPPVTTTLATVPVYYLGPVAPGGSQLRLFREFVPARVGAPATAEGKALGAARLAMGAPPAGSAYRSAWSGVTAQSVALGSGAITVRLSSGTTSAEPLATEQLVWTVQAALGKALPVRFELADSGTQVAPGHPVSSSFNRPSDPVAVLEQVAPIWVDAPARDAFVKAGAQLRVTGVASTFEATVEWELLKAGTRVDNGFTTASAGAPARGTYSFTTKKPLGTGPYVLRVFATSAKDGSVVAEQTVPVTAR